MWRWAGDTATDYNYYTKRTILSGVIASTRLVWFDDDDPEHQETQAFLDRRIDNVMQFEKVKGKLTKAVAKMQEEGSGLEQALDKLAQWRFRNDAK
jgi:ubiquinone biosynthesis protein COQ9